MPLDELGAVPQPVQLFFSPASAIPPSYTIRYFAETVQGRADEPGSITFRHRFCTAPLRKTSIHIVESIVSEFAGMERVLLLHKFITDALRALGQSVVGRSHLANTTVEVLTCLTLHYLFQLEPPHYCSRPVYLIGDCFDSSIIIQSTWSFRTRHASLSVIVTSAISHIDKGPCTSSFSSSSSITVSHACCSRLTKGAIADFRTVATSATKMSHSSLYRPGAFHRLASNAHSFPRPPLLCAKLTLCTWGSSGLLMRTN